MGNFVMRFLYSHILGMKKKSAWLAKNVGCILTVTI